MQALFDAGEPVATMDFRILKFLPPVKKQVRPPRPRPALTQDNAFWFEGAQAHRLLIQHCLSCGTLRHPPLPACAVCGSLEWDVVESSGKGTLYSYVVVHYPQVPSFEYPLPIGLVELEEGTRVVANLGGVEREDIRDRHGVAGRVRRLRRGPVVAGVRAGRWRGLSLMDFALTEEQRAVSEAAEGVFSGGLADPERIAMVECTEERFDRELWGALAAADLLGLAVPEAVGRRRLRPAGVVPLARGPGQRGGARPAVADPGAGGVARGPFRVGRRRRRPGCPAWWPAMSS